MGRSESGSEGCGGALRVWAGLRKKSSMASGSDGVPPLSGSLAQDLGSPRTAPMNRAATGVVRSQDSLTICWQKLEWGIWNLRGIWLWLVGASLV